MTAEVLSQLKVLRGGLADTVQGDPRYLTLNALDRSVAEIAAVAGTATGEAGAVPAQVLGQLKTIRDGIADGLRGDHRYLTLSALDKSIAEIGGMLASAGLIAPEHAAPMPPVHFEPSAPAAAPAAAPAEAPAAGPSKLKPVLETAAVIAAGVLAAEVLGEASKPAPMGRSKPKPAPVPDADKASDEDTAGNEADADEATDHDGDADEATSETKDGADSSDDEAAGDEADAAEGGETTSDERGSTGAAEAEDHDGKDDDEKTEANDETETPEKDGHDAKDADAGGHADKAKADDGDLMPDAAGVVPAGKASGYVPMAAKAGATQYQPGVSVKFGKLPNKVDLRSLMTPVEDQGDTSSCVANAVAGAYEYWIKKASKQDQNISRLFVYYNARWRDGSQDKDGGSVIQLAMEGLQKFGACPETVWPFDPRLVTKKPGGEAYKDAAPYRVQDMAQVPLKLDAWKQALAEGKPIVFGCALFDSFDECSKRGGVVPMPSPDDVARAKHSGHSMCAVGYSDTEKVFIVRNSWGADWGDKGYCYMPYDYLLNEKFNDGDCWVFVPKVPMQPPREVWSNTTEPVTNSGQGVDFEITTYTITDYAHIAVDLFERVRKPFKTTLLADYSQYVSWASSSLWSEFESFDFTTFLATTASLTGVSSLALESLTETSESSEKSESSESESLASSEESDEESEGSEESDSESEESDDTDEADDDESDDDESDGDDDGDEDSDGDDAEDPDGDDAEGDNDADDGAEDDESDGEGDEESEDDDSDEDEPDEDESDEDGGDDEGGEEEGGGDEGGGDDDDE